MGPALLFAEFLRESELKEEEESLVRGLLNSPVKNWVYSPV